MTSTKVLKDEIINLKEIIIKNNNTMLQNDNTMLQNENPTLAKTLYSFSRFSNFLFTASETDLQ